MKLYTIINYRDSTLKEGIMRYVIAIATQEQSEEISVINQSYENIKKYNKIGVAYVAIKGRML